MIERFRHLWQRQSRPKLGLALAGGGVIGGMYEVGVLAALEQHALHRAGRGFEIYVGCSAGSVVASVMANGVPASELYRILDQDLVDPLNFRRTAVFGSDSRRRAFAQFARIVWAVCKNAVAGRTSIPDMLARAERDFPAGFFSLTQLEGYMRGAFAARGLTNSFAALERALLIPAIELDRAERVVFGSGALADVPISHAVAASSAIPGFFEPFTIDGRDYVDGGVGFTGHADLAAEAGADVVVVVSPLVPSRFEQGERSLRQRGLYFIIEQTNRIYGQNLLTQSLAVTAARHPKTTFFVIQPEARGTPLFGPSMGFDASRAALRYGFASTREWLASHGADLVRRLATRAIPGRENGHTPAAPARRTPGSFRPGSQVSESTDAGPLPVPLTGNGKGSRHAPEAPERTEQIQTRARCADPGNGSSRARWTSGGSNGR